MRKKMNLYPNPKCKKCGAKCKLTGIEYRYLCRKCNSYADEK
jgi:tRNA(Ile2) C34 agmatinyltransferase TiaS